MSGLRKKPIVTNIIWSVISLIISTAITLFILPFISGKLGIEAYGFIGLCNNIITYIDIFSSAINIYAVKFISEEYHRNNIQKANSYYSSIFAANVLIILLLIVPSSLCITYIDRLIQVPTNLVNDVRILLVLSLINYTITLLGTVFGAAAFIKDILYKDAKIRAEGNVIRGLVLLLLFVNFVPHVWYVMISGIVCSAYVFALSIRITKRYTPSFKLSIKWVSAKAVFEVASKGLWNSVSSLGTVLNSGLDLIVTNYFLGAYKMGLLSVPKTLSAFIEQLLPAVVNSFRPQLLVCYVNKDKQGLYNGFISSMKACGIITCTVVSVFAAMGLQFLKLWIPNEDVQLIFRLIILTFIAETFTGFIKPLYYGFVLTGQLRVPCIANLLVGSFNVILMIVFLQTTNWGLYVVTITTVVGNIVGSFIFAPLYVSKVLEFAKGKLYKTIFRYIFTVISLILLLYYMFGKVSVSNWLAFLAWVILITVISVLLYIMFMYDKVEKRELFLLVRNKINNFAGKD